MIKQNPTAEKIAPRYAWYLPCKRAFDFLLALLLLLPLLPVIAVAAALVKLTSRGPAFYSQTRLGKGGREFKIYKIRTMINNAEAGTGPVWAAAGEDCRVTPVGHVLRNTHIDEFPQLFNVLLGDMSLIGPRPERPEFAAKLQWEIPHYGVRLGVRPGVTGVAQLRLPPDTGIDSVKKKLMYDIYYIQKVSPWLDFLILSYTGLWFAFDVVRGICRLFTLPSWDVAERQVRRALDLGTNSQTGDEGKWADRPVDPSMALGETSR